MAERVLDRPSFAPDIEGFRQRHTIKGSVEKGKSIPQQRQLSEVIDMDKLPSGVVEQFENDLADFLRAFGS